MVRNNDSITDLEPRDVGSQSLHRSNNFVPEHTTGRRRVIGKLEDIRPTKARNGHPHEELARLRLPQCPSLEARRSSAGTGNNT